MQASKRNRMKLKSTSLALCWCCYFVVFARHVESHGSGLLSLSSRATRASLLVIYRTLVRYLNCDTCCRQQPTAETPDIHLAQRVSLIEEEDCTEMFVCWLERMPYEQCSLHLGLIIGRFARLDHDEQISGAYNMNGHNHVPQYIHRHGPGGTLLTWISGDSDVHCD